MRRVVPNSSWPESWHYSYRYDLLEIYGDTANPGYSYAYTNRFQAAFDFIRSVCPPPASILDVAAGQGNATLALAESGYEVTWNDLRADLAGYAQLKHERGVVHYEATNLFELDPGRTFDLVLLAEIVEHVAHPDDLLRKVRSLVKPNGHVIVTTPNGEYFRNRLPKFSDCPEPSLFESDQFRPDADGHIFLLHTDELETLAHNAGFRLDRVRLLTNPLTAGHLRSGWLLKRLPEPVVWGVERLTQRLPARLNRKANVHLAAVLTAVSHA